MKKDLGKRKFVILCVDDESTPLLLRKYVLEKAGYKVICAGSAKQALQIFDEGAIDLVLTDLLMPERSGADLACDLKERQPNIPVVLVSGVNEVPPEASCADLFLSKLEGPASLCGKISELLEGPRRLATGQS